MRININDFGHELYEFTKKSHKGMSEEVLRNQLKDLFKRHGIDDSNFALISVAVSGNGTGVETEAKNSTTYIGKIAKKLFEKEERIAYREKFGKDPETPEDLKKTKREKPFISLDAHKISKFSSRTDIEAYITRQLAEQNRDGLDFSELRNKTVTQYIQNEFNMPVDLSSIEGKPLVSGLADSIMAKQSGERQAQNAMMSESQKQALDKETISMDISEEQIFNAQNEMLKGVNHEHTHSVIEPEKPKDKSNINEAETAKKSVQKVIKQDEEEFDVSEIGEGTGDINYFVGYDKAGVNKLFANKPKEFIAAFEEFVKRFNNLMNKLLNQDLAEQTVDQIQNDIDPEFLKFAALCNNYGAEGAQIQNLCRGMISIFNATCDAEREGKDLNGLKLKANLETTQALDFTDRDGLRREDTNTNEKESGTPVLVKAIDNAVGTKSLIAEDALTEEDQREIDMFGITGILTHSAMEMFRREPEYELLQSMNVFGLSKDDGTSV